MIAFGCEEKNKVAVPEERICPQCGEELEVFILKGKVLEEVVCTCGYVIQADS